MLLLRALLLWSLVSLHVVAGAVLFRRLFGRESPWYGFLVPALTLCIGMNFIENFIAIPSLLALLPFTTIGSLLLVIRPGITWEGLKHLLRQSPAPASDHPNDAADEPPERPGLWGEGLRPAAPAPAKAAPMSAAFSWHDMLLPLGIFLVSFAFTFFIRSIEPDILPSSDGLADLNLMANFMKGETLPPTDGWMPPFKLQYYYTFHHYAASVLTRLFGVDIGTGYNLSHALLSAFTCFVAAAAAWRITDRIWVTLLLPFIIESAATGSSAYLWMTEKNPSPWTMSDLSGGLLDPNKNPNNPIWNLLATAPYRESLRLQPPGFWTYRDEYHSNAAGHFLTIFAVWVLMELAAGERRNWPWIAAITVPFIAILTSTWALPITGLLCGGGLAIAIWNKRWPENIHFVLIAAAVGLICTWPSMQSIFGSPIPTPIIWNHKEWRTPFYEFIFQWWPIILLWASLLVVWPKLPAGLKWAHAVVPLMLILIEFFNIEDGRYNTIEKMWGYTYGAGLVAFFSAVAMRPGLGYRFVMGILLTSAFIAFYGWMYTTFRWIDWQGTAWHLEGNGLLRRDPQRARLLQVLSQLHNATILTGKVEWAYNASPSLAVFSGNRTYIAWTYSEEHYGHKGENDFRAQQVNDFYAGKAADPLGFLTSHSLAAVVIWPDDNIPDDLLATLKQQLAPYYTYIDCRGDGSSNAGIFLYQPSLVEKPQEAVPALPPAPAIPTVTNLAPAKP
jgi:hypothetical protein